MNRSYMHLIKMLLASIFILAGCEYNPNDVVDGGTSIEVVGIRGVVITADSQPSPNTQVVLRRMNSDLIHDEIRATMITKKDGSFFIPEQENGTYFLQAVDSTNNRGNRYFYIVDNDSGTKTIDTITLRSSGTIRISVLSCVDYPYYYEIDASVLKREFYINSSESCYIDSTSDTTRLTFTMSSLAPDTYTVRVVTTFYDASTINASRMKYSNIFIDTMVIVKDTEQIILPDVVVSTKISDELKTTFRADSLAYVSICRKCGVSEVIPMDAINMVSWRIESLIIRAVTSVSFDDIAEELNQLNSLRKVCLWNVTGDSLPEPIFRMDRLEALIISDGTLSNVQDEITQFPYLKTVMFDNDKLSMLPNFLSVIDQTQIRYVSLQNNPMVISSWQQQEIINNVCNYVQYCSLKPLMPDEFLVVKKLFDENGHQSQNIQSFITTRYGRVTGLYFPPEFPIHRIHQDIAALDSLRELIIGRHSLTSIPDCIGKLTVLEDLQLPNGELTDLPVFLSTMPKLHHLNVSNNRLSTVPSWIPTLGKIPFQSSLADFSCNLIVPSAVKYKGLDCLVEPQRTQQNETIDDALLNHDLEVVKRIFTRHNPYIRSGQTWLPYSYFIRIKRSRVIAISLPLISGGNESYKDPKNLDLLFQDLAELDSLSVLDLDMYLTSIEVRDKTIDEKLKAVTTRLPSIKELILSSTRAINRLPDGLLDIVPNVKRIGLRGQEFTEIPPVLKQMPDLEYVDLYFNSIMALNEADRAWMNKYCKVSPAVLSRPEGSSSHSDGMTWEESMRR